MPLHEEQEPFLRIEPGAAHELLRAGGVQVIDVRELHEYTAAHLAGTILVPLGTLLAQPREFLRSGPVLFVCSEGIRSAVACEAAAAVGCEEIYNLEGGIERWETVGLPVEWVAGPRPHAEQRAGGTTGPVDVAFLQKGEQLIRLHRFRLQRATGCAWASVDLLVEEALGPVEDETRRCIAKPDHPQRVPKPDLLGAGGTVWAALEQLLFRIRGRRAPDLFLPTA